MVRPKQKRRAALALVKGRKRSVARVCRALSLARSTFEYKSIKDLGPEIDLKKRLTELVERHRRWGLPRLHSILKKEGLVTNHKRTERIYREENMQIRRRKRKKRSNILRVARPAASKPNEVWSIDFVFDWVMTGRKLKCLTIVDDFTKESVAIFAAHSISGQEVTRYLESIGRKPLRIRSDNGPEFISSAMFSWCGDQGIEHELITPGKPNENAFIESFNSRFRDECLNEHVFLNLNDAKTKISEWRKIYNEIHPHSSLGMKSPKEFARDYEIMLSA